MHGRGSAKLVVREGAPYLERFYLLTVGSFSAFGHIFHMDDPDPLHEHPWPWGRIILRGRYREHYHDGTCEDFGPGHIVWHRHELVLHRVELLTPWVATIFWHWKRRRTWGFMHPGGWEQTPEEAQDGRESRGWIFPRKIGEAPHG